MATGIQEGSPGPHHRRYDQVSRVLVLLLLRLLLLPLMPQLVVGAPLLFSFVLVAGAGAGSEAPVPVAALLTLLPLLRLLKMSQHCQAHMLSQHYQAQTARLTTVLWKKPLGQIPRP